MPLATASPAARRTSGPGIPSPRARGSRPERSTLVTEPEARPGPGPAAGGREPEAALRLAGQDRDAAGLGLGVGRGEGPRV